MHAAPTSPDDSPMPRLSNTRTSRMARARLGRLLEGFATDEAVYEKVQSMVPEAWATLEEDIWCDPPKVKVSLWIDAPVAKFYRAMGKGYHRRINQVLATYAQMKIGEVERRQAGLRAMLDKHVFAVDDETRARYLETRHLLLETGIDPEKIDKLDAYFGVRER